MTMTPKGTRWWVARCKVEGESPYLIAPYTLSKFVFPDGDIGFDGPVSVTTNRSIEVCAKLWHLAGGFRLKPGEGPVQVTLRLVVRRVR